MTRPPILFSRPFRASAELSNIEAVLSSDHVHGDGPFTASATARLGQLTGSPHVLLTTSCTHALDMAALLLDLGPGDEVILPSFTFPSMATAVALRGARCVFVDIDPATGNIDPDLVAGAITPLTRAVFVMHYGGVAVDLDPLIELSEAHALPLVEDTAHGLGGTWKGRALGTIGTFGTLSFHDTKNIHCGEGGALLLSDDELMLRAEMVREKGTDRTRFLRGHVDKYSWRELGSSYLPSELNAAVLDAQLAQFIEIHGYRRKVWDTYDTELTDWAAHTGFRQMYVPPDRVHTSHLYYLLAPDREHRDALMNHLGLLGIAAPFHYMPLDSSAAGKRFGYTPIPCKHSAAFSERLIRLPLWPGMTESEVDRILAGVTSFRGQH